MSQVPRLYIGKEQLGEQSTIELDEKQSHYLIRVLRLTDGASVKLLGEAGEWLSMVERADKKHALLKVTKQLRPFTASPDIWLCFAPVKNEKIDFIAKRATELGVSAVWPVKTDYTQSARINAERIQANLVEAVEQCSRMDVPELKEYCSLAAMLDSWDENRTLFYADESGDAEPIHLKLQHMQKGAKTALLIGPEGGFSEAERNMLKTKPYIAACTLGPRILRAETAALTGLAHLQAWIGDGESKPSFVTNE